MNPWPQRIREEAHLLNPAFTCLTLISACAGFMEKCSRPIPFALAFMVLPIALHKQTRDALPHTTRTSVPAWLQRNAEARIGFYDRLLALRPYTREALHYGLASNWLEAVDSGNIAYIAPHSLIDIAIRQLSGDAKVCISRARFLGKWFAVTPSASTIMALWGVRP